MTVRELAAMSLLGAILYVGQVVLAFLPNIEVVSLLILVYTLVFGRKALMPLYAFVLLEGITYGFGLWWFMYLYVWTVLYGIVRLFHRNDSLLVWAVICGAYGLSFGALCSLPYLLIGGFGTALAWWTSGLLFDIFHCVGNFVVTLILYRPVKAVLTQIKTKLL